MQPNKTKIALIIGTLFLGASGAANADPFGVTVNTISDVTITPVDAIDFGENITTTASTSCLLTADDPESGTDGIWAVGLVDTDTQHDLVGAGCVGDSAQAGLWTINGVAGLDVTITVNSEVQGAGDFTFIPAGCATDFDGAIAGDLCTDLADGTPATITFADSTTDTDIAAGNTGTSQLLLGGTINVGATGLTSDLDYVATFTVDIVY